MFYPEGVQTVGIDRVIERAGVAKATLYNTFGSKENLVRAYLEARRLDTVARLRQGIDRHTDPRRRLLAVFDTQAALAADPDFRGCAFISASAEAPDGGQIQQATGVYRAEIRALLTDLARDAGAPDPAELARQLHLFYDGVGLAAHLDRDHGAAGAARAAAEILLDAALH